VPVWEARREVREGGRRGVVGREGSWVRVRVREVERERAMMGCCGVVDIGVLIFWRFSFFWKWFGR
jgi:hypothetical protein